MYLFQWYIFGDIQLSPEPIFTRKQPPLVMKGGDPYIRALMRTISASEASGNRPYSLLYGGEQVNDLSHHPQKCITIVTGPITGNCSTAAGRYQIINTTWDQDVVVYRWLNDVKVWGVNIPKLLQQQKLNDVLRKLSPTWTSLGYGIENNSVSSSLPKIYQQILKEELKQNTPTK